ncbi:ricin-type beta-trefoil lectin domain protein [Streptomyces sp. NPDC002644]
MPKVRQAFALPGPAAGPTTELKPASARAAVPSEDTDSTGTGVGMVPAPAPASTPTPAASAADTDTDTDSRTRPDADVTADPPVRESAPAPGAAAPADEQGTHAASSSVPPDGDTVVRTEAAPGRPKKPVLAAAAIAGAVLVSVPFLLSGSGDRDRSAAAVVVDSTDGTVLEEGSRRSGQYAAQSPSPSPSSEPTPSPSDTSEAADTDTDKKEKKPGSTDDAAEKSGKDTRAAAADSAEEAEKEDEPAADTKPDAAPVAGDTLVSKASGKCLSAGSGADGTQLTLQTCNGSAGQRWTFRSDGTIRAQGRCMDVAWGAQENGTVIQVADCSGNPAQQFRLNAVGDLVAGIAGKCVDILENRTADGSPAHLWSCFGAPNQKWSRR